MAKVNELITYHLNCRDVLFLFDVDVRNIDPDIWEVRCGLSHLSEHIARFVDVALVRQNTANTVRSPHILRIIAQHGTIELQSALLMTFLLLQVFDWMM